MNTWLRIQRSVWPVLITLCTIVAGCSHERPTALLPVAKSLEAFSEVRQLFNNPPAEYRTIPFWVWNDSLTEGEIDEQLADFKEKGIGGLFIHPRPGLITPYLSPEWHALVRHAVEKGKSLGLSIWLYDENSYPSGFAGGNVPAQMPGSYNEGQGLTLEKMDTLGPGKDYFLVLKREGDGYTDITGKGSRELGKKGEYCAFSLTYYKKSPWYGGYSYVDLLKKGVTEKFIDITMTGYEKTIREEFGRTVPGIFTDEPHIGPPGGIRWTPALFSEFEKRWGYDLKTRLSSLWYETGDWRKVRHNYYSTLLDLFIERWSKPWYTYCEENNLRWTGHYWEHEWPRPSQGPDNMAMYQWHHVPAIDILMNQYSEKVDAQFGNVRSIRELRSAANQAGRKFTLSEIYGAGGWDLRFEDMKRIADWHYVLGVNVLNQHLSYATIKGARKTDHPQSFSYHEPWWKFYRTIIDYCGRLSLALSSGEQRNHILVIEPTTSGWMYYSSGEENKSFSDLGPAFQEFLVALEAHQIEYDLGSEKTIGQLGNAENGKFIVGNRSYDLVIIPPGCENLNIPTVTLVSRYLRQGGDVLSFNDVPSYADGAKDDKLKTSAAEAKDHWTNARSPEKPSILARLQSAGIKFIEPEKLAGKLFHHRRVLADGEVLFLANTSLEEWSRGTFEVRGKSLLVLDAMTGRIEPYPAKPGDLGLNVSFDIPPAGELLLFSSSSGVQPEPASEGTSRAIVLHPVGRERIGRIAPNALTLDYCSLEFPDGTKESDVYYAKAATDLYKHFGLDGNPWNHRVQFKSEYLDKDHFPGNSSFKAAYTFLSQGDIDRSGLRAVVERPELWRLSVNGKFIDPLPQQYWLDRAFGLYDIGSSVKKGTNTLELVASRMTIHTELEPVYILGDFRVEPQDRGWKLLRTSPLEIAPWNKEGLPFYSNGVSYTRTFKIAKQNRRYVVVLPAWNGSIAEVELNGSGAGTIAAKPYELDVTDKIADGMNTLSVIVYGSLRNLLGPHHKNPPVGAAWPGNFEAAPDHQPPGTEYSTVEYGLFTDFKLYEFTGPARKSYARIYGGAGK